MIIIPFLHILSRLIFHMLTHAMHLRWFPFIIGIRRGILIFLFVTFVRIRQPHSLLCTLHMRVSEPARKHVCVCVGGVSGCTIACTVARLRRLESGAGK